MQEPLNNKLIVCFINEEVGHGVFANAFIEAGTIIGLYAGQIEENSDSDDYGFAINDNFRLNTSQYGGITRFIQHMPFSLQAIIEAINCSNKVSFINILKGNSIYLDENTIININNFDNLQRAKKINIVLLQQFTQEEQEEMVENNYLKEIDNLATANIKAYLLNYNNKLILYYQACCDIHQGEQFGVSYGLNYWHKKEITPQYVDKQGKKPPRSKQGPQ